MRKTALFIAMFSALSFPVSVSAADRIKPGLWSMTMKSDAIKNMPKMTPEQMEQMRKMGMNIPQIQDGGMVIKVCITKEMAERDQPLETIPNNSGCQMKNYNRNSNGYTVDIVCDNANIKGTGTTKGTFASSESFSSTYDFKGTAHGRPTSQHNETSGKWLGTDCGDVKPMGDVAKQP